MRRLWPLCVLLLALPACDGEEAVADGGGRSDDDGGNEVMEAGTASDAGSIDAEIPPLTPKPEYDTGLDAALATGACFDGADNNEDGLFDCADPSCQENVTSCCVGASSMHCCPDAASTTLAIDTCGGLLSTCFDSSVLTAFGTPATTVRTIDGAAALLPGGQPGDSGALLARTFDPRVGPVRVHARIASPLTAPSGAGVETVGVGFVDATTDPAMLSRVAPVAGVLVSRNLGQVQLIVAGEVVQSWTLETDLPIGYTVTIDPTGRVTLEYAPDPTSDVIVATAAFRTDRPLRAVVYGRTVNPDALTPPPARLLGVEVTPQRCDMPAALGRTSDTVVPAPMEDPSWADAHDAIERPHIVRWEDPVGVQNVRMALMIGGEVHLAEPGLGGFVLLTAPGTPALLPPSDGWAAGGVDHPVLRRVGSELELWFTAYEDGRGTIATAHWDGARFVSDGPVTGLEATASRGYASAVPFELGGTQIVVRVDDDSEGQGIQLFRYDGSTATPGNVVRAVRQTDHFSFDRDEIGSTSVVHLDGVTRVYYSGRRGTRWSVGVLASSDGVYWNEPPGGPILGASETGFDALGARDAALDLVGGLVHVYYTGDDGTRTRIGRALGATP